MIKNPFSMKKYIVIAGAAALFLLAPHLSLAAPTEVQNSSSSAHYSGSTTGSDAATFNSNTTTGNTIIVGIQYSSSAGTYPAISCSDPNDAAATYKFAASGTMAADTKGITILYSSNITGGTKPTVTCTLSPSVSYVSTAIHEYSGIASSSPLDVTSTKQAASTSTLLTGTSTTKVNGDLIFGAFAETKNGSGDTFTAGSGFTKRIDQGNTGGPSSGYTDEDKVQTSAGAVSASMTLAPSSDYVGVMATFKPVFSRVQQNDAEALSTSTGAVTFTSAQTKGNMNVVAFKYSDNATFTSLTDTKGNSYVPCATELDGGGSFPYKAAIYAAYNIASSTAGGNIVKLKISTNPTDDIRVWINEYSGAATSTACDVAARQANTTVGTGADNMTSTAATTNALDELIFGLGVPLTGTASAGTGFTSISTSGGNIAEDGVTTSTASYKATASDNTDSDHYIMEMATFEQPAGGPPGTPGTPTYAAVASSTLTVNWTAATGATFYNLKRATSSNGTYNLLLPTSSALTFNDTGLIPNTNYWYEVSATNANGTGPLSATSSVTMTSSLPTTPGTPTYSSISSSTLTVNWTAATGTVYYNLKLATSSNGTYNLRLPTSSALTFNDTGLATSTTYWYEVAGTNASGTGPFSATSSVTTTNPNNNIKFVQADSSTGHSGPVIGEAFNSNNTAGNFIIVLVSSSKDGQTWSSVVDKQGDTFASTTAVSINGFGAMQIWYAMNVKGGANNVTSTATITDTNFALDQEIFEYSGIIGSNALDTIATNFGQNPTPETVGPTTTTNANDLIFAAVKDPGAQRTWETPGANFAIEQPNPTSTTQESAAEDRIVSSVGSYSAGITPDGLGSNWGMVMATFKAAGTGGVPSVPGTPTYTNVSTSTLTVNWTSASGANFYNLKRATSSNGTYNLLLPTSSAVSYNDTGLTTSTTYWYEVAATNASGTGSYSATSSVMTLGTNPTTAATGTLDSATFDTGVASGTALNSFIWHGNEPAGTNAEFQFAVSNASSGPWNFWGTDGSSATYYTPAASTTQALNYALFSGYRYFRYRATLVSDTGQTQTPRVDEVIINWSP